MSDISSAPNAQTATPAPSKRRWLKYAIVTIFGLLLLLAALFVANGLWFADNELGYVRTTDHPPLPDITSGESVPVIKVMAFNIAKCFVYTEEDSFASKASVEKRVKDIATLIKLELPDLVFLSEAVTECGPRPVNQVREIAEKTGMHMWAFGENFNFGVPLMRMVGGNAILSRRPLELVANPSLPGRQPFYITKNNRRALWCAAQIAGKRVLLCSVHTDSFEIKNNHTQTQALLAFAGNTPAIMAGDFNANPDKSSIKLIRETGQFTGVFDSPVTFPSKNETLDYIFVPQSWKQIEYRIIESSVSDHYPIVARFEVRW